jgi:peptide/nickel transport system substrate-binding protein
MDSKLDAVQSLKLRKAVNMGFDRTKMIIYLRNGVGFPANGGFIPKGLPGFNAKAGYTYDPERAKALINAFKTETGIETPEVTLTTTSNYIDLCEFIQRELQKIGLNVTIDVVPPSTLKDAKATGQLDFFRASWIADYPDAENYLSLFYSKNFAPNGPNYSHYSNPEFDKLYEASFIETDTKKRQELYSEMDSLVLSAAPVVPLFYDEVVRFTRKDIEGLGINPTNLLELKQVRKSKN